MQDTFLWQGIFLLSWIPNDESESEEDDESAIREHNHRIIEEYSKNLPSHGVILDSMRRTFRTRRDHVLGGMPTATIFEQYPVFDDADWVCMHNAI